MTELPIHGRSCREHMETLFSGDPELYISGRAWISRKDAARLIDCETGALRTAKGELLAYKGSENSTTLTASDQSFFITYPWDFLKISEGLLAGLTTSGHSGEVHPAATIDGVLVTGPGTKILPGVHIEGTVVIGANCKIGPNCYIRGATSIGDGCHIGQSVEVKNSVIGHKTNVGHLSYIGDSVLGNGVNLGAGTTTSNLRHDGKNHRSLVAGELVDTGRRKFGTIIGDGCHTGINTSLYPGRKLAAQSTTLPGEIVSNDNF